VIARHFTFAKRSARRSRRPFTRIELFVTELEEERERLKQT
jgi:hypothetical protein